MCFRVGGARALLSNGLEGALPLTVASAGQAPRGRSKSAARERVFVSACSLQETFLGWKGF